jgi:predicted pyridoxine 5'-phosphate oxidase superfamily flavin-nucleotide-binding protein
LTIVSPTTSSAAISALDSQWLAASPMCLVATAGAAGSCDVSPRGDPPGWVLVLDERTIALPDRPGNRRVDGLRNILENPHVGLLFLVDGVNGSQISGGLTVRGSQRLAAILGSGPLPARLERVS